MPEKPGARKSAVMHEETPPPGYTFLEHIGAGSFGVVKLAKNQSTGEKVAIKIVSKNTLSDVEDVERVYRETFILTTLQNDNIIRLHQVLDTPRSIMLVMEYAGGGELFQLLQKKGRLSEVAACQVMTEILNGVEYCHRAKVTHRDLKLENILLDTSGKVKIADFGLSNSIKFGQKQRTHCGTPAYISPEQITGKTYSGAAVDIWALGVILFALVTGFQPFEASSLPTLYEKISSKSLIYPNYLSSECIDLLDHLLCPEVEKRFTLQETRSHPWVVMAYTGLRERLKARPAVSEAAIRTARRNCQNAHALRPKARKAEAVVRPGSLSSQTTTSQAMVGNRQLKRSTESVLAAETPRPLLPVATVPAEANKRLQIDPQLAVKPQRITAEPKRPAAVVKEPVGMGVSKAMFFPLARRRNSAATTTTTTTTTITTTSTTPKASPTASQPQSQQVLTNGVISNTAPSNSTVHTFAGYQGSLSILGSEHMNKATYTSSALSNNGRNILDNSTSKQKR